MDSVALDRYFEENRTKLIEDIAALIRIPSTRGPRPGQPYGKRPRKRFPPRFQLQNGWASGQKL